MAKIRTARFDHLNESVYTGTRSCLALPLIGKYAVPFRRWRSFRFYKKYFFLIFSICPEAYRNLNSFSQKKLLIKLIITGYLPSLFPFKTGLLLKAFTKIRMTCLQHAYYKFIFMCAAVYLKYKINFILIPRNCPLFGHIYACRLILCQNGRLFKIFNKFYIDSVCVAVFQLHICKCTSNF